MTEPPQSTVPVRSTEAEGPQLLRRLIGPLLRAGWTEDVLELWNEDLDDEPTSTFASVDLERSGCHISLSWNTSTQDRSVGDPTEGWEWTEDLPPLFPSTTSCASHWLSTPTMARKRRPRARPSRLLACSTPPGFISRNRQGPSSMTSSFCCGTKVFPRSRSTTEANPTRRRRTPHSGRSSPGGSPTACAPIP